MPECGWATRVVLRNIALLCLGPFIPFLHSQVTKEETVFHLHGVVLDSLTGKGISRALVTSVDHRLAVMTDSKGQFTFDIAVLPGSLEDRNAGGVRFGASILFSAERPGYSRMDPIAVDLDSTLSTRTAELRLTPAASITGHVYAPGTNYPRNVQVTLLQQVVQNGHLLWRPENSHNTDRFGAFHFANLRTGEYIVMTHEWRGETPLPFDRKSPSTQYPPVFLGDAPSLASATPLLLHAGEAANAELHLHSATYYPVSIPLNGQPSGLNVNIGSGFTSGYSLSYVPRDNAIEGALPNGSYDLHLVSQAAPDGLASAEVNIHVAGAPLRTASVTLAPADDIPVRIHLELTSPSAPTEVGLNLQLQPDDIGAGQFGGFMQPGETEFTVKNVQPGRYSVLAMPSHGYVSRMTFGQNDLQEHPLTVNASTHADFIDVTVRDDVATLSGNLQIAEDAPPSRSTVLLVAEHSDRPVQTVFLTNGLNFTLGNIPPGTYRLFALTSLKGELPYRDPEAMLPWLSRGKLVTLAPGEKLTADAPLVTPPDAGEEASSRRGTQ